MTGPNHYSPVGMTTLLPTATLRKFIVTIQNIHTPNLNVTDLNLLIVFEALYREQSVTRAGERIGLAQLANVHKALSDSHLGSAVATKIPTDCCANTGQRSARTSDLRPASLPSRFSGSKHLPPLPYGWRWRSVFCSFMRAVNQSNMSSDRFLLGCVCVMVFEPFLQFFRYAVNNRNRYRWPHC